VFLLLIFFLISAQITQPPPFEMRPAVTQDAARLTPQQQVLWINADGALAFGAQRGNAVWPLLAGLEGPLNIQADAALPAREIAQILPRLAAIGITDVTLVTLPGLAQ